MASWSITWYIIIGVWFLLVFLLFVGGGWSEKDIGVVDV